MVVRSGDVSLLLHYRTNAKILLEQAELGTVRRLGPGPRGVEQP